MGRPRNQAKKCSRWAPRSVSKAAERWALKGHIGVKWVMRMEKGFPRLGDNGSKRGRYGRATWCLQLLEDKGQARNGER